MSPPFDAHDQGPRAFATTHWSVVVQAGEQGSPAASAALERLCGTYWYPVYAEQDAEGRYLEEPAVTEQPETLFDRRWRLALLDAAFARLKQEYAGDKKEKLFEHLKPFLAREVTAGGYDQPARDLGMNPPAVAVAVYRLRQRYGEVVRAIVSETLANPADVDDELRQLFV